MYEFSNQNHCHVTDMPKCIYIEKDSHWNGEYFTLNENDLPYWRLVGPQ